ncbi:MAG: histidine kinase dimerization/phospho-acceptor domain-containing protein [Thermoleophilia bacterium]
MTKSGEEGRGEQHPAGAKETLPGSGEVLATQRLRTLSQLIAGVAHEINNPLTSVQGLASLLLGDAADEESRQDLEIVVSEVTRAVKIVRNLRAFAGHPDDPVQSCSLNHLAAQVVDVRGYETRARGIDLSLSWAEGLPPLLAVPTDVLQLVLMLLLRAERAVMESHSNEDAAQRITIATGLRDGTLVLIVEDNGRTPDEPTADATLAACAAAAAQLGGTLREERGADGGSTVTVELPADI